MNSNVIGTFPTMITPYEANGEVSYARAADYVRWYHEKGCHGIFSVCQSSEIAYLSLEERVKLNRTVYETAESIARTGGRRMTVVSSGHVADSIEDQIYELNKIAESGTDALILITNRLDPNNEGDDIFIKNGERLLRGLPENIKLGFYECPLPYKRLVTPRILEWCLSTDRFYFMKDTCCDAAEIARRLEILKGSHFALLNANCQTLLQSLRAGGAGYCGIMCNFHPELYVWLCENFEKDAEKAEQIQNLIGTVGFTEGGLPYPLTAKYHMCLEGILTENFARNRRSEELTDYARECVRQMRELARFYINNLKMFD